MSCDSNPPSQHGQLYAQSTEIIGTVKDRELENASL